MEHLSVVSPPNTIELKNWHLDGRDITESEKRIKHLHGLFKDEESYNKLHPETLVYSVQAHHPVPEGTPGGLFFGTTIVQPGRVGTEYFMTRGHSHLNEERTEYYWGVQGEGILILMNKQRETWGENIFPGSLHFIRGFLAHRVANTGPTQLIFGASWPADAGHNYDDIAREGFSARLMEVSGKPTLVSI